MKDAKKFLYPLMWSTFFAPLRFVQTHMHSAMLVTASFLFVVHPLLFSRESENKLVPSAVPVNIHPVNEDETRWGIGHSLITLSYDWEEAFWSTHPEDPGEIIYTVNNIVFGQMKTENGISSRERSLILGIISMEEEDGTYYSAQRSKTITTSCDGSGYDIGFRLALSRTFHKSVTGSGFTAVDWNYAFSFHTALYWTEARYSARSYDGLDRSGYSEWEGGLFFRPVAALQPVVHLHPNVSLIPFIGAGCNASLYCNYWEEDEFVLNGIETEWHEDGDEINIELLDFRIYYGFDIGFAFSESRKHELSVGGSINRILGAERETFSELHIMYAWMY